MTTVKHMDAMEMTKHRRRPLPDTPQADAYVRMMHEVATFHDALARANPTEGQLAQMTATLASVREMLEGQAVPEQDRLYGLGEVGGSQSQAMMPPLTIESVDDHQLRAHTVAGEFFMGMNQAMHGGVVAVLFDTALGRLAMGSQQRSCRTAYLTTQYRNITPLGERLELRATLDSTEGQKRFISGQIWHGETLCAEADSLFIELKPGQQ